MKAGKSQIIQAILKDCFWDYDLTEEDIGGIVESGDEREKMWLFEKILYNSRDPLKALTIFKRDQLSRLFKEFVVPEHKRGHIERRFLALKHILLGEKTKIKGLEWNI